MSLSLQILDSCLDKRWDDFILSHPYSSIYHHRLWKELIQKTYRYQPYYFVLQNSNGIRAGAAFFLVKSKITGTRMVSLPFSDYCDPLINDQNEFDALFSEVIKKSKNLGASHIEFRSKFSSRQFDTCVKNETENNRNHVLELMGSLEEIENKFHDSCIRRSIKKAGKNKIKIVCGTDQKDMRIFYEFMVLTRKRHGLPPQPYDFFYNMWELLYPQDILDVLLATYEDRPIAGIVIVRFKDTMYYLYGGSDSNFNNKRPNHLLLWKAIQMAHSEGLKYFDFGRTAVDNQGLMDFKRRWGTKEFKITSYTYPKVKKHKLLLNRNGTKSGLFYSLTKKLPTPILKLGGNLFYKHLG